MDEPGIASISHAIDLSVAPVFLLLGIGSMLSVMTNRLARVVDRARGVEAKLGAIPAEELGVSEAFLATLSRRAKLINRAITFCTITALLICAVIATLFTSAFLDFDATIPIAVLFITAVSSLFLGMLYFLREIFVATAALRIGAR
jgi:hypothetical protein